MAPRGLPGELVAKITQSCDVLTLRATHSGVTQSLKTESPHALDLFVCAAKVSVRNRSRRWRWACGGPAARAAASRPAAMVVPPPARSWAMRGSNLSGPSMFLRVPLFVWGGGLVVGKPKRSGTTNRLSFFFYADPFLGRLFEGCFRGKPKGNQEGLLAGPLSKP